MKKTCKKTNCKLESVYDFIVDFNDKNGYCPSLRQIGEKLGISTPSLVKYYLDMLEKNGKILRGAPPRRIIIVPQKSERKKSEKIPSVDCVAVNKKQIETENVFYCPIVGSVAAGLPILATENISDYYPLPTNSFNKDDTFMLKIVGDSMVNAGIFDGDTVIVDRTKEAENSKIVVALIDDSATVKRFFRKEDRIVLHPENESYQDIIVNSDQNFIILGVIVGLIRKF